MADIKTALDNLVKAHGRLHEFAALPVATNRDKAGIIQAFEFTFERFWKTFQKLAPDAGLTAETPRQALQAGSRMGFIPAEHASVWAQMLADRNLTSHTYCDDLAESVFSRIVGDYLPCFDEALRRLRADVG